MTQSVPARAAAAQTAAAAGFALGKQEECSGRGDGCRGWCQRGNGNAAPESRSHDLSYVFAAAEAGAHWTSASREFGITL